MSDDSQVPLPRAFVDLFVAAGASRPSRTRADIAARHELCEDMAQMLIEPAQARRYDLGLTEDDVLERMHRGLVGPDTALDLAAPEAAWVICRLAELLQWPIPGWLVPATMLPPATRAKKRQAGPL